MRKFLLFLTVLLAPVVSKAFTPAIAVTVKDGTLQAGTAAGFNVSSGTAVSFYSSSATVQNLAVTSGTISNFYASSITVQNINGTFPGMGRNRVINGDFFWDQRNEGGTAALTISSNTYGADRFFGSNRGYPGKFSMQRVSASPPAPFSFDWKITVTSATLFVASSETANAEYVLSTRVEGQNWADSNWGQTGGVSSATVSFWVRSSSAGYYGFSLESQSSNPDTYPTHFYVPTANTWTYVTMTFPGDSSGPWSYGQGTIGLKLIWDLGSGSAFEKTSSAWYGGLSQEYNRLTNDNRIMKNLNETFELAGVQCELGSKATAFEFTPIQTSYQNVVRYFRKSYQRGTKPGAVTSTGRIALGWSKVAAAASKSDTYPFIPQTAIDPTSCLFYAPDGTAGSWLFTDTTGAAADSAVTAGDTQKDGIFLNAASTQLFGQGHFVCDSEL